MIEGIGGGSGPVGLGVEGNGAGELRTEFMNLLITQMKNQDPFSPMDSSAMVEQLATFSNLEQLQGINDRLDASMVLNQSLNNTMMMDLVGKRVTVAGNEVQLKGGVPSRTLIRTSTGGKATAEIKDSTGVVVRTVDPQNVKAGFNTIEWDGNDDNGDPLPDGQYTIEVTVSDPDGVPGGVVTFQSGIVEAIQFDNNFQTLIVNGRPYSPADVVEVGVGDPIVVAAPPGSEEDDEEGEGPPAGNGQPVGLPDPLPWPPSGDDLE